MKRGRLESGPGQRARITVAIATVHVAVGVLVLETVVEFDKFVGV